MRGVNLIQVNLASRRAPDGAWVSGTAENANLGGYRAEVSAHYARRENIECGHTGSF